MFEIAVVNEPSVFEPLKFYCMSMNLVLALCFGTYIGIISTV